MTDEVITVDTVTLKEHLLQRVDHTLRILDERASALKLALDLQATENHRRLEILNGEAERLRTMQATYYPRELADLATASIQERLLVIEKALVAQEARGKVITAVISAVVSLFVAFGGKLFGL